MERELCAVLCEGMGGYITDGTIGMIMSRRWYKGIVLLFTSRFIVLIYFISLAS